MMNTRSCAHFILITYERDTFQIYADMAALITPCPSSHSWSHRRLPTDRNNANNASLCLLRTSTHASEVQARYVDAIVCRGVGG